MSDRILVITASLVLLTGVAAGAFGAHGLKRVIDPSMLSVWQTAVLYQLVHGLGLLALAALGTRFGSPLLTYAGFFMFAGIVIFSGSLYTLVLSQIKWLGAITPIGGMAFLIAWALVALVAYRAA
ncbi:DUF423 domain-containing protein [Allopusillimonas ginsengisoli]|nr:DUF423 domain-containing protein [Allopusillimonas ginsengisoli]